MIAFNGCPCITSSRFPASRFCSMDEQGADFFYRDIMNVCNEILDRADYLTLCINNMQRVLQAIDDIKEKSIVSEVDANNLLVENLTVANMPSFLASLDSLENAVSYLQAADLEALRPQITTITDLTSKALLKLCDTFLNLVEYRSECSEALVLLPKVSQAILLRKDEAGRQIHLKGYYNIRSKSMTDFLAPYIRKVTAQEDEDEILAAFDAYLNASIEIFSKELDLARVIFPDVSNYDIIRRELANHAFEYSLDFIRNIVLSKLTPRTEDISTETVVNINFALSFVEKFECSIDQAAANPNLAACNLQSLGGAVNAVVISCLDAMSRLVLKLQEIAITSACNDSDLIMEASTIISLYLKLLSGHDRLFSRPSSNSRRTKEFFDDHLVTCLTLFLRIIDHHAQHLAKKSSILWRESSPELLSKLSQCFASICGMNNASYLRRSFEGNKVLQLTIHSELDQYHKLQKMQFISSVTNIVGILNLPQSTMHFKDRLKTFAADVESLLAGLRPLAINDDADRAAIINVLRSTLLQQYKNFLLDNAEMIESSATLKKLVKLHPTTLEGEIDALFTAVSRR